MCKRLFLCLLLTANFYSVEAIEHDKLLNCAILIATVGIGIYVLPGLYPTLQEIYEYTFPTEEQSVAKQVDAIAAAANIKYYEARIKFRNCLMNNKSDCEKNSSGCPMACEELAQNFIALGYQNEVDRMTKAFNEFGQ